MEKENTQQIYTDEANSYEYIGCSIAKGELTPPGGTIYESRNIVLAADPEVPIPGFFIITGRRHVNSFSMLYKEEWMEMGEVISKAERAIKNLGLAQEITLVQEERSKHFHIWIFPTKDWMIEKFGRGVSCLRDISRYAMENATESDWEEVEEAVREIRAEFHKEKDLLEVKEKNLDRREWYNDTQRDFKCMYQKDEYFEGGVGLITFTGLTEPEMVDSPKGELCIADNGYQWLELAPKGGNYVITSMFRKGEIFQHYIDITLRNDIAENGDAKFYDLFLDVVVSEDGKAQTIDQNELEEAYNDGVITKEELVLARKAAGDVLKLLDKNKEMLEQKIIEYRRILSESL